MVYLSANTIGLAIQVARTPTEKFLVISKRLNAKNISKAESSSFLLIVLKNVIFIRVMFCEFSFLLCKVLVKMCFASKIVFCWSISVFGTTISVLPFCNPENRIYA